VTTAVNSGDSFGPLWSSALQKFVFYNSKLVFFNPIRTSHATNVAHFICRIEKIAKYSSNELGNF